MSLFDDVIVNVAAAVDAVGKKTTEVVDRSKVRVSSVELKNKISARFETLGRYVYDTHAAKNTDPSVVDQYVSEITVLINELKTLQDSLNASNGKTVCPKCSCSNSADSLFCKKCGASLDFTNTYTTPIPTPVNSAEPEKEAEKAEDAAESFETAETEETAVSEVEEADVQDVIDSDLSGE